MEALFVPFEILEGFVTERKKIQKVIIASGPENYHGSLCGGRKKTFPMWTVDGGKYRKPGAEAKAVSQSVPSAGRWPTALDT